MANHLKLLICSGNLGNAEPDDQSLEAWVPSDGLLSEVTDNQKYPVVENEDFEILPGTEDDALGKPVIDSDKKEKFELIVFGMQESTFAPERGEDFDSKTAASDSATNNSGKESISQRKESKKQPSLESVLVKGVSSKEKEDLVTSFSTKSLSDSLNKAASSASSQIKVVNKAATKAIKTSKSQATKAAKSSIDQVNKVTKETEKVAHQLNSLATLTATRDHTKEIGELIADGTAVLHDRLHKRLPSYKRLLSFQRGEMRLLVYSLESKHHVVEIKSVRAQNTGKAGLANKGGIVAEVTINKSTTIAFMSCHLEAHEGVSKYSMRCSTLADIFQGTKKSAVPSIYPDASLANHFCFVFGDLNFRTRYKGRIKYEEQIHDVNKLVLEKDWKELNDHDELRMALNNRECLYGFRTMHCPFPPTFKVERGDGYVYKTNRTPSYTDRILWRTGDMLEKKVAPLAYEPIDEYTTSDHKPIRGAFEIHLNRPFIKHRVSDQRPNLRNWHFEVEDTENVHLFISELECDIFPTSFEVSPDTYVCVVSLPEDILLKKPTKIKQWSNAVKKFVQVNGENSIDIDGTDSNSKEWPRTGVFRESYNPKFTKEIHCALKTQRDDKTPINLAGSMLHIFVFKHSTRQRDEVVGSYPINLDHLFRSSILRGGVQTTERRSSGLQSMRQSMSNSLQNLFASDTSQPATLPNENKIVSVDINGPLLKNGKQMGVLRCTVDAWAVHDVLSSTCGVGDGLKDVTGISREDSNNDMPIFSSRHSLHGTKSQTEKSIEEKVSEKVLGIFGIGATSKDKKKGRVDCDG